ncbi:unnamed protein product [Coccothraustes coccothraustes]
MVAPALLALALGALGVVAVPPESPQVSLSALDPTLSVPFIVTCSIGHDVPVTNITNITITADNLAFPVTLSQDGRQATATVTVNQINVLLGCTVHLGSRKIQNSTTVQASYIPVPLLDVTNTTEAGTELKGKCSLPAGAIADIQVKVLAGGRGVLAGPQKPPVPFSLRVQEEDAQRGLNVTCVAEIMHLTQKNKSQLIRVLVKPRLDIELCPPQQNWTQGQEILICSATGSPEPQVRCSKDGNSLMPGRLRPADLTRAAGTYLCRATNELGTAERNVTVWVQYDDSLPLLAVLLGTLLPAAALLGLTGLFLLYRYNTKIGEYWLWRRQPPPDVQPLRPPGSSQAAAAAPNGSAAP